MRRFVISAFVLWVGLALTLPTTVNLSAQEAGPQVGQTVPGFTLPDTHGGNHSIGDYGDKYVVLEWLNYGCPSVKKHYNAGNMQMLQEQYTEKDVVWLAIVSSGPGKQGHYGPEEMNALSAEQGSRASAVLLDPSGEVGHLYQAQVTPHMMVVGPGSTLIYNGAIDDKPGTRPETLVGAHNYVAAALDESMAGGEVSVALTKPYG